MIFDICHMDMLSVYGVFGLQNRSLEWRDQSELVMYRKAPYIMQIINNWKYVYVFFLPWIKQITLTLG